MPRTLKTVNLDQSQQAVNAKETVMQHSLIRDPLNKYMTALAYSQSRSLRCTDLQGRYMGDRQGPLLRIPALAALMRPCMSRRECRFCIVTGMSLIKAMQEQLPRSKNLPPVRLDSRIGCRPE